MVRYAELLENTQYALMATVQKLYIMIRSKESWELGEPETNDRGQPVVHDIASKLGCIRPTPDLPVAFAEGAEDFAELQAKLQATRAEMGGEDSGSRNLSGSLPRPPSPAHTEQTSGIESGCAVLSKDYNQNTWAQQGQQRQTTAKVIPPLPRENDTPLRLQRSNENDGSYEYLGRVPFDTTASMPSPIYGGLQTQSPMLRKASLFSCLANEDFLGYQPMDLVRPEVPNFADGTINPHMLDRNGYNPSSQVNKAMCGTSTGVR